MGNSLITFKLLDLNLAQIVNINYFSLEKICYKFYYINETAVLLLYLQRTQILVLNFWNAFYSFKKEINFFCP